MFSSDSHVLVAPNVASGRGTYLLHAQDDVEQVPAPLLFRGFPPYL